MSKHNWFRTLLLGISATTGVLGTWTSAHAISIRHDVPASEYFALANQFTATGRLDEGGGALCSASLVAPDKVLTAAHCVDGIRGPIDNRADINLASTFFKIGSDVGSPDAVRNVTSVAVNNWNGNANGDMAILTLASPINNFAPMQLSSLDPSGLVGTMIGYGYHGTGANFNYGEDDLRRGAQNIIDVTGGTTETDFDHPNGSTNSTGSATPLRLEGTTASGDSGGPLIADFGFGPAIVGVLNGGFNPFGQESEYGDISIWASVRRQANVNFLTNNGLTLINDPPMTTGDFNNDGNYDCSDVDALTAVIAQGTNNATYDLTGDAVVNDADLTAWLAEAGAENLPSGNSYLRGDINLDGTVDGQDFLTWNNNKFTSNNAWCSGDLNADGSVDGQDFVVWNDNKFQTADIARNITLRGHVASVPEPSSMLLSLLAIAATRCCCRRAT